VEIHTPKRIAELRLNNAVDTDDYRAALEVVRMMGLDAKTIPHERVRKDRR
jgi:hypothetical protein